MNKNKGITLVSLVITIIVMLILAGVSLNMLVGDGSVLERANMAVIETEKAGIVEELRTMLLDYNMQVRAGTVKDTIEVFLGDQVGKKIDSFKVLPLGGETKFVVEKKGYYFYVEKQGNEYLIEPMGTTLGQIESGYTVVTEEQMLNKENGTFAFNLEGDQTATVIFYDEIKNTFNFEINGGNVTIHVTQDMILTNEGMKRSAIKIAKGATLNLNIAEGKTIIVNSGFGEDGTEANNVLGAAGGPGGYAGINVPAGANFHVYGAGKLIAYGGDAGDGGGSVSGNKGGGGGGGAGAGIGGNGGTGGSAGETFTKGDTSKTLAYVRENGLTLKNSGQDGGPGESCGNIYFHGTTEVYAYGGAGGSGGSKNTSNNSGAGGGGYPAAGIGGGGAGGGGGDHACPSGGYSAGSGEAGVTAGANGRTCSKTNRAWMVTAGSYYQMGIPSTYAINSSKQTFFNQGGLWTAKNNGDIQYFMDHSGSGGDAGAGGNVYYSDASKIFAYNGDMITNGKYDQAFDYDADGTQGPLITKKVKKEGTENEYIIPAKIFAQEGIIRPKYDTNQHMSDDEAKACGVDPCTGVDTTYIVKINDGNPDNPTTGYNNGFRQNQGIGSGAGNLEQSNGTFAKIQN